MTVADRIALIESFTRAWTARDVDALMALMAQDCEFKASIGPEPGTTFTGRASVRQGYELFLGPGRPGGSTTTEEEEMLVSEDFAVTRWTSRASGSGPNGSPGSAEVVVRACDIFEFTGDRISRKDTYRKSVPPTL